MGPGQDPCAIEILTDEGVTGFAANYGGGEAACLVIAKHFKRFLIGEEPFNIERLWDQMYRSTLPYGLGGVTAMAMSGVDLHFGISWARLSVSRFTSCSEDRPRILSPAT
jgi:L-alanine-DL-glutamate epimerase-like enolase superfamily enzyme